jgi:hypothetical protein
LHRISQNRLSWEGMKCASLLYTVLTYPNVRRRQMKDTPTPATVVHSI